MAGSFRHITKGDGTFRGIELIDHLGDAHEALEECYWMIVWLTGGDLVKMHQAYIEGYFKKFCPPGNRPRTFEEYWHDYEE